MFIIQQKLNIIVFSINFKSRVSFGVSNIFIMLKQKKNVQQKTRYNFHVHVTLFSCK